MICLDKNFKFSFLRYKYEEVFKLLFQIREGRRSGKMFGLKNTYARGLRFTLNMYNSKNFTVENYIKTPAATYHKIFS